MALTAGSAYADDFQSSPATIAPISAKFNYFGVGMTQYDFDYSKTEISAGVAYQQGLNGWGQTIAVLDSGVDRTNPDLQWKVLPGYDAITNTGGVSGDVNGHGTFVTGLIAAEGIGIEGTAFNATVYPVQVLASNGSLAVNDAQLAAATAVPFSQGVRIFNNSWNSTTPITVVNVPSILAQFSNSLAVWQTAVNMGAVFVFAAGNESSPQVGVMAGLPLLFRGLQPGWLAVVATDVTGQLAGYSNACGAAAAFCLAAPGSNLVSTFHSGYGQGSGTSFATPIVSSAIAILTQEFPYLKANQAAQILLATANKSGIYANSSVYGQGFLNLAAAVQPVGTITIPGSNTVTGQQVSATGTAALGSASFAQSWARNVGPILTLDSFGRGYTVDSSSFSATPTHTLNTLTATQQYGLGEMDQIGKDTYGFYSANAFEGEKLGRIAIKSSSGATFEGSIGTDPAFAFGSFASGVVPAGALIVSDGVGNPYMNLADQAGTVHAAVPVQTALGDLKIGASVFSGYARTGDLTAQMTDPSYTPPTVSGGELEVTAPVGLIDGSISFNAGGVDESARLLGGSTAGAFGQTNSTTTYFAGISAEAKIADNLHLIGGFEMGQSNASQSASALNVQYGTLTSESFHAGIVADEVFNKKDKMGFVVSQPLRVSGGDVSVDVPYARDFAGNVLSQHEMVGASDNGHEMDMQSFYAFRQSDKSSFDAGVLVRFQPDNVSTARPDTIGLVRWTGKF